MWLAKAPAGRMQGIFSLSVKETEHRQWRSIHSFPVRWAEVLAPSEQSMWPRLVKGDHKSPPLPVLSLFLVSLFLIFGHTTRHVGS